MRRCEKIIWTVDVIFSFPFFFCFVLFCCCYIYNVLSFWANILGLPGKYGKKYISAVAWSDRSDIQPDVCGGWDSLLKKWTMHCCLHQRILNTPNRNVHFEFKQRPPICAHKQLDKFLSSQPPGRKTTSVPTSLQFNYLWSIRAWKYYVGNSINKPFTSFKLGAILSIVIKSCTIPPAPPKTWTIPLSSSLSIYAAHP